MIRSSLGVLKAFSFLDVQIVSLSALTKTMTDQICFYSLLPPKKELTSALAYLTVATVS